MWNRIIQQFVSNYVTERLLASPAFHRFAARTHEKVTVIKDRSGDVAQQIKQSEFVQDKQRRASTFSRVFKETMDEEIKKLK